MNAQPARRTFSLLQTIGVVWATVLVVVPLLVPAIVVLARGMVTPSDCGGLDGQMGILLALRYALVPGIVLSVLALLAHRVGLARRSWVLGLATVYALAAATFWALNSDWCT